MSSMTLDDVRTAYHKKILTNLLGQKVNSGAYSNADNASDVSKELARRVATKLQSRTRQKACKKPPGGQTLGNLFSRFTKEFLDQAFGRLQHLRPGEWVFSTSQDTGGIANYYQYEHLAQLEKILSENPKLRSALGGDYLITPDITVSRRPVKDRDINKSGPFV